MQAGTGQCINLLQQNPSAHMHYASMAAWSSLLITRKHHRMLLSYHVSYALLGCGSGVLVLVLLFVLSLFLALFVSACHSATYLATGLSTTF